MLANHNQYGLLASTLHMHKFPIKHATIQLDLIVFGLLFNQLSSSAQNKNRIFCKVSFHSISITSYRVNDQSHFAWKQTIRLKAFRSRKTLIDKIGLNLKQFNMY